MIYSFFKPAPAEPTDRNVKLGRFTYSYSNREWRPKAVAVDGGWCSSWTDGTYTERWLVHDENEFCAGVFTSKAEAVAACERWTIGRADLLTVEWQEAPEDACDSHRGTYIVHLDGCQRAKSFCCGWHTMDYQIAFTLKVRNLIAEHGVPVVRTMWQALIG